MSTDLYVPYTANIAALTQFTLIPNIINPYSGDEGSSRKAYKPPMQPNHLVF